MPSDVSGNALAQSSMCLSKFTVEPHSPAVHAVVPPPLLLGGLLRQLVLGLLEATNDSLNIR